MCFRTTFGTSMRTVYLFLISLCFLLTGAQSHVYGLAPANEQVYTQVKAHDIAQALKAKHDLQVQSPNIAPGTSDTDAFFVSDDEDDLGSSGIHHLLSKHALVLSLVFFFCSFSAAKKPLLPIGDHFHYIYSYIYLSQRCLRI